MDKSNQSSKEKIFKNPAPEDCSETQDEPQGTDGNKNKSPESNSGNRQGLRKEDLPDATNESTGAMGSGQRQDSN
jgi:hypothetical protein